MTAKPFPEWVKTLYRGVRAAVSAGLAQAFLLKPNWSDPDEALRTVAVAFVAGFLPALGKVLREQLDAYFGWDSNSLPSKLMPI